MPKGLVCQHSSECRVSAVLFSSAGLGSCSLHPWALLESGEVQAMRLLFFLYAGNGERAACFVRTPLWWINFPLERLRMAHPKEIAERPSSPSRALKGLCVGREWRGLRSPGTASPKAWGSLCRLPVPVLPEGDGLPLPPSDSSTRSVRNLSGKRQNSVHE